MIRKLSPYVLLFFLLVGAQAALGADVRFELGFGWTLVGPSMNGTYANNYKPPLTPVDRYIDSSASQAVGFRGKTALGLNGFFTVFFTENIGLQVLADYHRPGIGGSNDPYDIMVQFLAFQPETYANELEWPNSAGNLTETTFSLNALARFPIADKLALSVSGGPSIFHFEGKAGYIGYTYFEVAQVGPDIELSGMTYQMIVDFGPQTKYGMNLGAELAYEAFRHVILALDLRWFGAPSTDLQLHIVEDDVIEKPIGEIEAAIGLGTLNVNPSYFRAGLALRFVF